MQTPHQTLAVQALRKTRCVEEIAHGRNSRLEIPRSIDAAQSATPAGTLAEGSDGAPSVWNCRCAFRRSFRCILAQRNRSSNPPKRRFDLEVLAAILSPGAPFNGLGSYA